MADEQIAGKSLFQKIRLYILVVIAALAVIIIFQNTDNVKTQLLLWSITMPLAALLSVATLVGFAGGVVWVGFRRRR